MACQDVDGADAREHRKRKDTARRNSSPAAAAVDYEMGGRGLCGTKPSGG